MSLSRMVVLGLLAESGPMHGHQLRRQADSMHVESWGGVSPGALYRELHQLAAEGLIELLRSEQVGRRPPRTVYRVSDSGLAALRALRDEALTVCVRPPDIVGVGLLFGALEEPGKALALLERRREVTTEALDKLVAKRARLQERDAVSPAVLTVFRRSELFLRAELAWHEEYAAQLGTTALKSAGTGTSRARAQRVARPRRRSTSREDATTPAAVEGPTGSR
jgi:DNA-binding PadR family transcriptional regulator